MNEHHVQSHLGHLREHRLILVGVPQVDTLDMGAPRVQAPHFKQRLTRPVFIGQRQRNLLVGDDVLMQIKADTKLLQQVIGPVQRADVVTPEDQHQAIVIEGDRPDHVLLRSEFIEGEWFDDGPVLSGHEDRISPERLANRQ